jgi:hypothetical protein
MFSLNDVAFLAAVAAPAGVVATGGDTVTDITVDGISYRVHQFTTVGTSTFTVTADGDVEYLVVAGGGGGGRYFSGGGGGGGLLTNVGGSPLPVTAQAYSVVVGAGGTALTSGNSGGAIGGNGGNSSFAGFTAIGGGGGAGLSSGSVNGNPGGSGGGGGGSLVAMTMLIMVAVAVAVPGVPGQIQMEAAREMQETVVLA